MNKDNLIIVALWVRKSKPPMGILLEPLKTLFYNLSTVGIDLETTAGSTNNVKFRHLYGLFDLVAKDQFCNSMVKMVAQRAYTLVFGILQGTTFLIHNIPAELTVLL